MKDLAFLMSTVTKNIDVLEIHRHLFLKYWIECDVQRYLTINASDNTYDNFLSLYDKIIYSGIDTNNYIGLILALKKITESYILFSLEDDFLYANVDTKRLKYLFQQMKGMDAVFLSLTPNTDYNLKQNDINLVPEEIPYRFNFQVGIWKKDFLLTLLQNYSNMWDFERCAHKDVCTQGTKVLSTLYTGYPYIECVRRGKWLPEAITLLANENIPIDTTKRNVLSNWEVFKFACKGFIFNLNRNLVTKLVNKFHIGYKIK